MILKNHKLGRSGQFMVSRALRCAWDHSLAEALKPPAPTIKSDGSQRKHPSATTPFGRASERIHP